MFSATTGSSRDPGVAVLVRDDARLLVGRPNGPRSMGCLRFKLELCERISSDILTNPGQNLLSIRVGPRQWLAINVCGSFVVWHCVHLHASSERVHTRLGLHIGLGPQGGGEESEDRRSRWSAG